MQLLMQTRINRVKEPMTDIGSSAWDSVDFSHPFNFSNELIKDIVSLFLKPYLIQEIIT